MKHLTAAQRQRGQLPRRAVPFTNPAAESESGTIPGGQIGLTLTRSVQDGIHEDLDVAYHGPEPVRFTLDIALRSDFADLFEVKGQAIVRRGQRYTRWDSGRAIGERVLTERRQAMRH